MVLVIIVVLFLLAMFQLLSYRPKPDQPAPSPIPSDPAFPEAFAPYVSFARHEISPGAGIFNWVLAVDKAAPADVLKAVELTNERAVLLGGLSGFGKQQLIDTLSFFYQNPTWSSTQSQSRPARI